MSRLARSASDGFLFPSLALWASRQKRTLSPGDTDGNSTPDRSRRPFSSLAERLEPGAFGRVLSYFVWSRTGEVPARLRQVRVGRSAVGAVAGTNGRCHGRGSQSSGLSYARLRHVGGDAKTPGRSGHPLAPRGGRRVLLRTADQVLGDGPRSNTVGDVHAR